MIPPDSSKGKDNYYGVTVEDMVFDSHIGRPLTNQIIPLVKEYYALPGNGAGGKLHIVLDDFNIHNIHIEWCLKLAEEKNDKMGVIIAKSLLLMTITQRSKVVLSRFR